jgi:Raf kinase inhibitor-like YbhB/YbcL family protein
MILAALLAAALAQAPAAPAPEAASKPPVAIERPETATTGPTLSVSSTAFGEGGFIPLENSGYGKNRAPEVHWSAGPDKTRAYVLIVEDPDAGGAQPLLHWLAYDIAPPLTQLPAKTRNAKTVDEPGPPFSQGVNDHGGLGWTGPHPPVGEAPHRYRFQVFALDRKTGVKPGADREAVLRAMKGHVIARGETIGLFRQAPERVRRDKEKKGAPPEPSAPPAAPAPQS